MLNELLISKDGKYIIYQDLIHEIGKKTEKIDVLNLFEVFKKQSQFLYENKIWDNSNLISFGRKLIYEMDNGLDIILEYERNFQNLLTESVTTYKDLNEGLWSWLKEKGSNAINRVKGIADNLIKGGWTYFFNKLRDVLYHPAMIGVDVALTAIGVGKVATMVVWGALLIWELKTLIETGMNMNTVLNVVFAAIGVAIPAFAKSGKVATQGVKTAEDLAKTSVGGKVLTTFTSVFSKVIDVLSKSIEWLSGLFGSKVQSLVSGAISNFRNYFNKIVKFLTPKSSLTGRKVTKAMVGQAAVKGAVSGAAFSGGEKLLNKGLESETGQKAIMYGAQKLGLAPSDEELEKEREKIKNELSDVLITPESADEINQELLNQLKNQE